MFTQTTLEGPHPGWSRKNPMIKSILACLLFVGCTLAQTPTTVSFSTQSANLVALERMWNQAQVSRDSMAIAGMIGDKFINTEYDGEVSNRGKFLADFADPKFKPSLMNSENVEVATYGTTAIVTGDYHTKGLYASKPYEHFGRFTDTWVFQDGKWLCVASHSSLRK
jgi:ketosteroid isomerase-like protein